MVEDNNILVSQKIIYKNKLDLDLCKKAFDFIFELKDKFKERSWDCDIKTSFNCTDNILNVTELHKLKLNIISHIENHMRQNKLFFDGFIFQSWVNIYEKKFYQEFHTHKNHIANFFSGVIYLTEKNSKIELDIVNRIGITPEFGDILIFEDDLPHRVVHNEEDLRISLAFNYKKCEKWNGINLKE
jgi:hypothetical protein